LTVRFTLPLGSEGFQIEYGWGDAPVPMPGEAVCFDGSDPEVPEGTYYVKHRWFDVGLRGLNMVECVLRGEPVPLLGSEGGAAT
jgi:hypothetical protein